MKKLALIAALSIPALAACTPEAEDKVEDAYEEKADNLEDKADAIVDEAEAKADKLNEKADKLDDMSDKMGDMVETGTMDKSKAMPEKVIDNAENKVEEIVAE